MKGFDSIEVVEDADLVDVGGSEPLYHPHATTVGFSGFKLEKVFLPDKENGLSVSHPTLPTRHDEDTQLDMDVETPVAWSVPTSEFRGRMFWHSLSPAQRAAIARRPRFKNQPHLRLANQPGPSDQLP